MRQTTSPIAIDDLLTHAGWVRSLARSLVHDDATADDVAQQVWTSALRRPPQRGAGVRGWLASVTRNAARERGRSEARRGHRERAVARDEATAATIDVVARGELHRRLVTAVMDLDEPYRETLLLRFFEDLPPRDVAARMGAPVETVRTRTRRALERLRSRLDDDDDGRRESWRALLVPVADGAVAKRDAGRAAPRGGRSMPWMVKIAAVAALVAGVPVAYLAWGPGDAPAPPAPRDGDTPPPVAPATDDGARRARVRTPPAPPPAPAEDDAGGGGIRPFGEPNALPPAEDAAVFADGVLEIALSTDPELPRSDAPWAVVVTFRNAGTGPLRFHVPEHTGLVPFPEIELRSAEGTAYAIVASSFQSMWMHGVQGEIVRLEPGEERRIVSRVSGVAEIDPTQPRDPRRLARTQKRTVLAPGDFTISATMRKERPVVPWGEANFRQSEKDVPGLWTGEVRATPMAVRLGLPDTPVLELEAPEPLTPGGDLTASLTLENPTQEERTVRGPFGVRRSEKGGPSYVGWFRFGDAAEGCAEAESADVVLGAGEKRTCRIDLGALAWTATPSRFSRQPRLPWPHVRNYVALWVTAGVRDENGEGLLGSNSHFRALEPAPDLAADGFELTLDTALLDQRPRRLIVRLRNGRSGEPVRVPLDVSRRLLFTVSEGRERRSAPVVANGHVSGVTELSTNEPVTWDVLLADGWPDASPPGDGWVLQAHWANADARGALLIGRVASAPVPITIR